MKIIHIVQNLDCGGLEHLVVQMAAEQKKRGHETEIICLGAEGQLAEKARDSGIVVSCLGHRGGLSLILLLKLTRAIARSGSDLVHTHNMGPLIYGSIAARLAGVKSINTRHGRAPTKAMPFIWNMNEFVVAVSEDAKKRMMEFNKIKHEKVRVIRNGIEVAGYRLQVTGCRLPDSDPATLDLIPCTFNKNSTFIEPLTTGDNFVVGTVGRLSWEKNQALLLRAFAEFRKQVTESNLVIIGDGAERENLEKLAVELSINDNVKFLGYRDDVPSLMAGMDVFVLPSLEEGLSLTLLEAMDAGLPIIATDVGGNGEVVVDGETGLVVASDDAKALADAILKLHDDEELRKKMGAAGRRRVEEHFSLNAMVDEYMELYERGEEDHRP